jgi:hypothetical protein
VDLAASGPGGGRQVTVQPSPVTLGLLVCESKLAAGPQWNDARSRMPCCGVGVLDGEAC